MEPKTNDSKNDGSMTSVPSHCFVKVDDPDCLLPILVPRLPFAAHIFNNVKLFKKWMDVFTFWVLDGDLSQNSLIVLVMSHEDVGQEMSISRPPDGTKITPAITSAFSSHPAIDWTKCYGFFDIDADLCSMVLEISVRVKKNAVSFYPAVLYHLDPLEAVSLDDSGCQIDQKRIEIKTLDNEEGRSFIGSTWKYAPGGSGMSAYIDRNLSRNPSIGIYVDGTLVTGVVQACYGRLGMLHTVPSHRGQGYGKLAMAALIKKISGNCGLIPNCMVEVGNEASKAFQKTVGLREVGHTYFAMFAKSQYH